MEAGSITLLAVLRHKVTGYVLYLSLRKWQQMDKVPLSIPEIRTICEDFKNVDRQNCDAEESKLSKHWISR